MHLRISHMLEKSVKILKWYDAFAKKKKKVYYKRRNNVLQNAAQTKD